jgi:hypothetical protein
VQYWAVVNRGKITKKTNNRFIPGLTQYYIQAARKQQLNFGATKKTNKKKIKYWEASIKNIVFIYNY